MKFEKEFYEALKSSEAKKIIKEMFDKWREEEGLNQYQIKYQKEKELTEQLQRDIRSKDNTINKLQYDIKSKDNNIEKLQEDVRARENKINQLEKELESKRLEYRMLQKDYEDVKRELASYQNDFLVAMEKYKSYQEVSNTTREGLSNVICEKNVIDFIISCANIDNLGRIWKYTKEILSDYNRAKDVEILKEIFDYFFKVYNESLPEPTYERDDVDVGDDFDDEYQSRSRESASSGTIKKILLRGYSSINTGNVICKSVVQV